MAFESIEILRFCGMWLKFKCRGTGAYITRGD